MEQAAGAQCPGRPGVHQGCGVLAEDRQWAGTTSAALRVDRPPGCGIGPLSEPFPALPSPSPHGVF